MPARVELQLPAHSARTVDNAAMPDINVQHLMAMLLIDGALSFGSIHDAARMREPRILALRHRIALKPSEELMHARPRRQAIVTVKTRTLNQDGAEVLSLERVFYVHKRGASQARSAFPQAATPLVP